MLNPGPDKPAVPDEIRHSDFYQKLSDVFGLVERDFWSDRSWKSLANALRREALMCMVYDTASHEVQIEAILKCYFESKVPRLIHLATKFADVLIKQEKEGSYIDKHGFFTNQVLRIGYMSMIAEVIEKEILHEDIQVLLDKFREEGVQHQLNPLLESVKKFITESIKSLQGV